MRSSLSIMEEKRSLATLLVFPFRVHVKIFAANNDERSTAFFNLRRLDRIVGLLRRLTDIYATIRVRCTVSLI